MAEPAAEEVIDVLVKRAEFMTALSDEPERKPALVDRLPVARSTVDRALRELERVGLVARCESGYKLTTAGELALSAYQAFHGTVAGVARAEDVLAPIAESSLVDPALFPDCEVVRAGLSAPDRAIREAVSLVEGATRVRGVSPATHTAYVDVFHERVVEHGMETELVFSEDALAQLTGTHVEKFTPALETGYVSVYQVADMPPLGLILVDDADGPSEVALVVYTDRGIHGVVRNDTPEALAWGVEAFRTVRDRAERVHEGEHVRSTEGPATDD